MKNNSNIRKYCALYNKEFVMAPNDQLYCNLCSKTVDHKRKYTIEKHRRSLKHSTLLSQLNSEEPAKQDFISVKKREFLEILTTALISIDLPLHKLRNNSLKRLFNFMTYPLPSESSMRRYIIQNTYPAVLNKLKDYVKNKEIFLVVDETSINLEKYAMVLIGTIESPKVVYAANLIHLKAPITHQIVVNIINETFDILEIESKQFLLLLSDDASYMRKAADHLKIVHPNLFSIKCIAHLIHNCAMRLKIHYKDADNMISAIKSITAKNKENKRILSKAGNIPDVIVTRWSSWLGAALIYSKILPEIKLHFKEITQKGILIENAKTAIFKETITKELEEIFNCYRGLVVLADELEDSKHSIESAFKRINEFDFKDDPCNLKSYIQERMFKNDLNNILELSNDKISPATYSQLKNCQPTSIDVERSFSMLKRMLREDRNYNGNNIPYYFICYFNSVDE